MNPTHAIRHSRDSENPESEQTEGLSMTPQRLLQHFDRISDAPDAIPRLRRFILDLAVRGKLVEQDPRDEPASELLKRIHAERARRSNDRVIRQNSAGNQEVPDEMPFELPQSWVWSSLGEISQYGLPDKVNSNKEVSANTWVLDLEDIEKDTSRLIERVPSSACPFQSSKTRFKQGDVLFGKLRPYLNKVLVADSDGVCTTEIVPVRGFGGIAPEYIRLVLKSPLTMKRIDRLMYGMKMPRLGTNDALRLNFPLSPLAEQQRIVAKVDELMALCDRLEATQAERESRRNRLVASSLNRLNNAVNDDAFPDHAHFYFNHLPRFTTKPEHIQQLRQTILNLAVRGKLVPQDPSDEHAPEFGIEKEMSEANRIQLKLPSRWSWTRVENVAESRLGKMLDKAKNSGKPYRYLRNTNVHWFNIKLEELKVLRIEADEVEKYVLRNGDILICEGGHGIGRTAVWRGAEPKIVFQKALHRVRPGLALNSDFFAYCICVYFYSGVLQTYFTGVGIPHFTGVALSKLVFPLPPIKEQQRIVAKVDELMALCDKFDAQLTTSHTESCRLLEAMLHEALAPAV